MYDELVKRLRRYSENVVAYKLDADFASAIQEAADAIEELSKRVPKSPHGRLIDADALMSEFEKAQRTMEQHGQEYSCSFLSSSQELSTEWYCVEDMLENAPTIIPADPAEEGE